MKTRSFPLPTRSIARSAGPGLLVFVTACSAPPDPLPHTPAPARSLTGATTTATPAPTTTSVAAEEPPLPPPCLTEELRKEGHLAHAEKLEGDRLAVCVEKGIGLNVPEACFALDFATSTYHPFATATRVMQSIRLEAPELPDSHGSATIAHAAGTMEVCGDEVDCFKFRFRPAEKDAWDEVFSSEPGWSIPGTSRVIVARSQEGAYPKEGPPPLSLWLEVYDLKQKRKVSSALVKKDVYALGFYPIGQRALLTACRRDDEGCSMLVVDPKALSTTSLPIDLNPGLSRLAARDAITLLPLEDGSSALMDAQGGKVLVLTEKGEVARTIALPNSSDLAVGPARAGLWKGGRMVVLESGPAAGTVHLLDPRDGRIATFVPPPCAVP